MKKKIFLLVVVIFLLGMTVTGCSTEETSYISKTAGNKTADNEMSGSGTGD